MEAPISKPVQRYLKLKLKESLCTPYQYSIACNELSFFLKNAYSEFPKNLQSLVFQDTLFAFSLIPQLQTESAISAANLLLHNAESVLPKQKRVLAVKEHKHASVMLKRKFKTYQTDQGECLLPRDILIHIFRFLDWQSLVSASAVCWSWNTAANENQLWEFLFHTIIFKSDNYSKTKRFGMIKSEEKFCSSDDTDTTVFKWRCAFREMNKGKVKFDRGYCYSCSSIVWLTNDSCHLNQYSKHRTTLVITQQVVNYIMYESLYREKPSSDSESDDDDDDGSMFKLWAFPRQIIS